MNDLRLGILLWNQAVDWPAFEDGARRVEALGYESLWTWDHLYAIFGDPEQPIFEGWSTLAAWAKVTTRVRLGLLVGAIPFRNPGLVAKTATTLDHISNGRAILGLGGAWFEHEHTAHGIDFGASVGERLGWLDEACAACRDLFDGKRVTSPPDGHYQFRDLVLQPPPIQKRLPIMIGGGGEKKTLRTVARYADMWNISATTEVLRHKVEVLERHCEEVGRDPAEITRTISCKPYIRNTEAEARRVMAATMEANKVSGREADHTFWVGPPQLLAEKLIEARELGFNTMIPEVAAPYDWESVERFMTEVKPLVDAA